MANISDLRADVRVFANNCPDITIDKYVIQAIRDFCQETWYYQQTLSINQVSGTSVYQIVPSNNDEVVAIDSVDQGDVSLSPVDQHEADIVGGFWGASTYQFEPPNYLAIYPEPTESIANNLQLRLVLQPPENTTTIPDSIYRNFKQTIVSGALSYLLAMQNEAWSNAELAKYKTQDFNIGKFTAKGQRSKGFRAGSIRVKPRGFLV